MLLWMARSVTVALLTIGTATKQKQTKVLLLLFLALLVPLLHEIRMMTMTKIGGRTDFVVEGEWHVASVVVASVVQFRGGG